MWPTFDWPSAVTARNFSGCNRISRSSGEAGLATGTAVSWSRRVTWWYVTTRFRCSTPASPRTGPTGLPRTRARGRMVLAACIQHRPGLRRFRSTGSPPSRRLMAKCPARLRQFRSNAQRHPLNLRSRGRMPSQVGTGSTCKCSTQPASPSLRRLQLAL